MRNVETAKPVTAKPIRLPKVERSFDGLRNVMFDQLDDLISGAGKPEIANSVARLASEITKSTAIQAELMRLAGSKSLRKQIRIKGINILR